MIRVHSSITSAPYAGWGLQILINIANHFFAIYNRYYRHALLSIRNYVPFTPTPQLYVNESFTFNQDTWVVDMNVTIKKDKPGKPRSVGTSQNGL